MKILILTDSLSLAREYKGEVISYEETYPYLLKKQFPHIDFVFTCIGGATIKKLTLNNPLNNFFILNLRC